jgi:type I restriction enzyme S subunit
MNGKQLRNSILQWAIQGKLVPQDPNDEPASVLLERIREEKARLVKEKKIKRDKNESIIYRGDDNSYYEKFADGKVVCIDDEIPFEIPASWEWCRITHLANSLLGKTLDRGKEQGKEYPYLCSINVYWNRIDLTKVKSFKLQENELERYRLQNGDLLICEGGDYGRCAVWDRDEEMYYQNALHRVRFFCNSSPSFFKNVFEFYRQVGYIVGQGQTIKHFTYENMKSLLFPLPPYKEQIRITNKLNQILELVNNYEESQERLDRINIQINDLLKKSILQEAIRGKLVSQDASEEPASILLQRIKEKKMNLVKEGKLKKRGVIDSTIFRGDDNKYFEKKGKVIICIDEEIPFEIPDTWQWCRVKQILDIGSARRVHQKDWRTSGIPFYRAREIGKLAEYDHVDNELFIDYDLYKEFSSSGVPKPGDLMITAVGTLGKVYIVKNEDLFYYKDGSVLCLNNRYKINPFYLKHVIDSPMFKNQYVGESEGTTVATLTMVRFNEYLLPIPPLREQERIVKAIDNLASIMSR